MENKLLEIAIKASINAGDEILKVYNTEDFGIETKSDKSPLTLADKAAHEIIIKYLGETVFPVLSEEGKNIDYSTRSKWDKYWLVDPLDGTKEFIKRNGEFTVNIALIEKQVPIMGVVYVPVSGDIYYADKNGAFKSNGKQKFKQVLEKSKKLPEEKSLDEFVVVGSRSHMSTETREYIESIDTKGKALKMISKGSSLKICLVAEGSAHCYPRLGPTMEWDTAAGHAIALFANKKVEIFKENRALTYNKENLLNPYFIVH
jgi:3'(2'), 5'-bisphosphate nucleotidase